MIEHSEGGSQGMFPEATDFLRNLVDEKEPAYQELGKRFPTRAKRNCQESGSGKACLVEE